MHTIKATNVNGAYNDALWRMKVAGRKTESRNGEVMTVDGPVVTMYERPLERMLFDTARDANPFFHVMEAMWMLAGRRDVESIAKYNSNIATFSDDGTVLKGAYGFRWREQFDVDQIDGVIKLLKKDPQTRRAVISMYDPVFDLDAAIDGGKDVPCNTTIYFRNSGGHLTMTVCCRSNDIIWGCYGANVVHMSFLHELVANAVSLPLGPYYQISNDWHVYPRHYDLVKNVATSGLNPYTRGLNHCDLLADEVIEPMNFCDSLNNLFDGGQDYMEFAYGREVLVHLKAAWSSYKLGHKTTAAEQAGRIIDDAVREACLLWLGRRAA